MRGKTGTIVAVLAGAALLAAAPAHSREPDKPITDRDPDAVDVATTPVGDLNLRKDEIPPVLIAARQDPYSLSGLGRCRQIASAVEELDAILGDDVDIPQVGGKSIRPGKLAQWVVGSFIPFRGLIREISGANEQERQLQLAIQAGVARRSFLKGWGQAKACKYPARPATAQVLVARQAEAERVADEKSAAKKNGEKQPRTSGQ